MPIGVRRHSGILKIEGLVLHSKSNIYAAVFAVNREKKERVGLRFWNTASGIVENLSFIGSRIWRLPFDQPGCESRSNRPRICTVSAKYVLAVHRILRATVNRIFR